MKKYFTCPIGAGAPIAVVLWSFYFGVPTAAACGQPITAEQIMHGAPISEANMPCQSQPRERNTTPRPGSGSQQFDQQQKRNSEKKYARQNCLSAKEFFQYFDRESGIKMMRMSCPFAGTNDVLRRAETQYAQWKREEQRQERLAASAQRELEQINQRLAQQEVDRINEQLKREAALKMPPPKQANPFATPSSNSNQAAVNNQPPSGSKSGGAGCGSDITGLGGGSAPRAPCRSANPFRVQAPATRSASNPFRSAANAGQQTGTPTVQQQTALAGNVVDELGRMRSGQIATLPQSETGASSSNPFGQVQDASNLDARQSALRTEPNVAKSTMGGQCSAVKENIDWVFRDRGAQATYAQQMQAGKSDFEAVVGAQGHNRPVQDLLRRCQSVAEAYLASRGAPGEGVDGPTAEASNTYGLSADIRQTLDRLINDPSRLNTYLASLNTVDSDKAKAYVANKKAGYNTALREALRRRLANQNTDDDVNDCAGMRARIQAHAPDEQWIIDTMARSNCNPTGTPMVAGSAKRWIAPLAGSDWCKSMSTNVAMKDTATYYNACVSDPASTKTVAQQGRQSTIRQQNPSRQGGMRSPPANNSFFGGPNPFGQANDAPQKQLGDPTNCYWDEYGKPCHPDAATATGKSLNPRQHLLRDALRARLARADREAAAERSFLKDMAVLVALAEPLKSDDPIRISVIDSLREQLKDYDFDVDAYFNQYDLAHGKVSSWKDPFLENSERALREWKEAEAKAAAARPMLTAQQEEYCRLFADRAMRGDLTPALAKSPGGTFQSMCRAVVQDAVEDEAAVLGDSAPGGAGWEGAATKTSRELFQGGK